MQGHDFACRFAGLLFAGALGIGSATASSIALEVSVESPWPPGGGAGARYSSTDGLVITSDPGAYGSVFGSGALNLTSNVVGAQLNKPEPEPFNGWSRSSANLATGTIRVEAGGLNTNVTSNARFSDSVTFFNPNRMVSSIHVLWDIEGVVNSSGHGAEGWLQFGDAFLMFWAFEGGIINAEWEGWSSAPKFSRRGSHGAQLLATYDLAPRMNDTKQLSMSVNSDCIDNFCGYRETLRFDLGNTGVTFTSGSGVLLTAVVPEPGTLGLSLMGTALTALIVLGRKRMRP